MEVRPGPQNGSLPISSAFTWTLKLKGGPSSESATSNESTEGTIGEGSVNIAQKQGLVIFCENKPASSNIGNDKEIQRPFKRPNEKDA